MNKLGFKPSILPDLQVLIDTKEFVANVQPPEGHDGIMQYAHNTDAPKPENNKVPAVTDCCYGPHFGRYRVSIGYSAFVPEENNLIQSVKTNYADKTKLHIPQIADALEGIFKHYGLQHNEAGFGYYHPANHRYMEWIVAEKDFGKGKALIGALVQSKANTPKALKADIDRAMQEYKTTHKHMPSLDSGEPS